VLFAEHQTAGRGQRGNRWESTAGKGFGSPSFCDPRSTKRFPRLNGLGCRSYFQGDPKRIFSPKQRSNCQTTSRLMGARSLACSSRCARRKKRPISPIAGIGINVNQSLEDFRRSCKAGQFRWPWRWVDKLIVKVRRRDLRNLDRTYASVLLLEGGPRSLCSMQIQAAKPHLF